jgi:PAS domain S-box-containing protein
MAKNVTLEQDNISLKAQLLEVQSSFDESQHVFKQIIDFSSKLGATTELNELYRNCLQLFKGLLHLDFATLFLVTTNQDGLMIHDTLGFSKSMIKKFKVCKGVGLPGLVLESQCLETVEDFHTEKRFSIPDVIFKNNITSAIATPMMINKQLFGVIIGHSIKKTLFSGGEKSLAQIFANQSATAIKNASHIQSLHISEQKLKQRTDEFETIFANSMVGIMLLKGGKILARCNQRLADFMGYDSPEELQGMKMQQLHLSKEKFLDFRKRFYDTLVSGEQVQIEYQIRKKDGNPLWCLLSGKAIDSKSPPDLNKGVVWIVDDISRRKEIEEELLKVKKLESIGVLAGGIAHDFNNILSAILGNIELAGYCIAEKDSQATLLLSDAEKATKRAAKLTDQLLTFSKGGEPIKVKTSLPELMTESAEFVLHGSNVICRYDFPERLWMVDADSGQISQVIQNMIINAQHAMPNGGIVTIQCTNFQQTATELLLNIQEGDYVRIRIEDTGAGIAEDVIDKIFDPYFTTKQNGNGLGLAVCHSVINKHNGIITVESLSGKGTTFTIYLPAIRTIKKSTPEKTEKSLGVKAARVIVMDDEEMLRHLAESQLALLGHESILVIDGTEAINRYQELQDLGIPADLVIMDLTIPGGMGGQEAAEKLLQIDPAAKIIVASGYSNDPVMADYKKYGFCAAVAKPFDLKALNYAIASALRKP